MVELDGKTHVEVVKSMFIVYKLFIVLLEIIWGRKVKLFYSFALIFLVMKHDKKQGTAIIMN